jgi:hypothetical protein
MGNRERETNWRDLSSLHPLSPIFFPVAQDPRSRFPIPCSRSNPELLNVPRHWRRVRDQTGQPVVRHGAPLPPHGKAHRHMHRRSRAENAHIAPFFRQPMYSVILSARPGPTANILHVT